MQDWAWALLARFAQGNLALPELRYLRIKFIVPPYFNSMFNDWDEFYNDAVSDGLRFARAGGLKVSSDHTEYWDVVERGFSDTGGAYDPNATASPNDIDRMQFMEGMLWPKVHFGCSKRSEKRGIVP